MLRDRSSTAVKSPNVLVTFSNEIYGFAWGSAQGAKLRRVLPSDFIGVPCPETAYWPVTTLVHMRVT